MLNRYAFHQSQVEAPEGNILLHAFCAFIYKTHFNCTGAGYTVAGDLFCVSQYFVRVSLSGTLDWVPIDISTMNYSDYIVIDGNIQFRTRD